MPGGVATSTGMQSQFGPGVTLIDFTAKWCGPCKVMEPVMHALATEYAGRVKVVAIDVDEEQLLTQQYNVRSMPTFVLVRDGVEVGRTIGSRPRAFIAGMIDRALAGDRAIASPRGQAVAASPADMQASSCLRARCKSTAT
jgi:thioredoxin